VWALASYQYNTAVKEYLAWIKKYYPEGSVSDWLNVAAYTQAQLLVNTLRRCGDELRGENVMRQAVSIRT